MEISDLIAQMQMTAPADQFEQLRKLGLTALGPQNTTFANTGLLVNLERIKNNAYMKDQFDFGDQLQQLINFLGSQMQAKKQ